MISSNNFSGRKGFYTGSSGLKVAYLSGEDGINASNESPTHFSASDVDSLMSSAPSGGVDILLTTCWPRGVAKYASDIVR